MSVIYERKEWSDSSVKKVSLSEHLDEMIKSKMPEMLQVMFTSMIQNAFYELFTRIRTQNQH